MCIARKNAGINSNFTLRKISYGEGVERIFPLYSPRITAIEVVRRGAVRRAKLYYLRGRRGKAARIAERGREDNRRERVPVTGPAAAETEAGHEPSLTSSWSIPMAQPRTLFDKIWDSHVIAPAGRRHLPALHRPSPLSMR